MIEYISKGALVCHLNRRLKWLRKQYGDYDHYTNGYDECVEAVEDFPTADVVPRAVIDEIFWEIDKLLTMIYTDDDDGSKFIGVDMQKYYALKKKYTGDEKALAEGMKNDG